MIHSNSVGDFFNIGAARLTDRGDRIDVRNLQRQKRVCAMLDELRAVNVSHQHRRHKWLINLLHEIDGMFALCSDHNPVGMHQVRYCTAFAQKFRVADDVEVRAVAVVSFD